MTLPAKLHGRNPIRKFTMQVQGSRHVVTQRRVKMTEAEQNLGRDPGSPHDDALTAHKKKWGWECPLCNRFKVPQGQFGWTKKTARDAYYKHYRIFHEADWDTTDNSYPPNLEDVIEHHGLKSGV